MPNRLGKEEDLAEGLIQGAYNMDVGIEPRAGFDVEEAVARVGVRFVHEIWAVNQLFRQTPELHEHLEEYPDGILAQVLKLSIERQVASGVHKRDNLLKQYGFRK